MSSSKNVLRGVSTSSRWLHIFTRVTVSIIAAGAAVLSFDALTAVAVASNIRPELAWVWAVVIDGFILIATTATFALRGRSWREKWYPWAVLGLFVLFSIAANAWHAMLRDDGYVLPDGVAMVVTGVPPLALFLAIHLLIIMISPTGEQKTDLKRKSGVQKKIEIAREKALLQVGLIEADRLVKEAKGADSVKGQEPAPVKPLGGAVSPVGVVLTQTPAPTVVERQGAVIERPVPVSGGGDGLLSGEGNIFAWLRGFEERGEGLPNAKALADAMGSSVRTGQNWLKRYRANNGEGSGDVI